MTTVTYINGIKLTHWRKEIMEELVRFNVAERPHFKVATDIHLAVHVENLMDEEGIDWSECDEAEFRSETRSAILKIIQNN